MIGSARGTAGRPQQKSAQVFRYPAPQGGIDARKSLGSEDLSTCVYTYNLLPFEYGMRVRSGYQEWQQDLNSGSATGVNTLIPFDSPLEGGSGDRLFAITNEGIWNATDYAVAPILMVTFPDQVQGAGYGTFAHYTGDDGKGIVFYADKLNGLYEYDPEGNGGLGVWAAVPFDPTTGIAGVNPANIKFVVVHKARIWFAEANTADAWYLDIGAKRGTAVVFHLGAKFRHGGSLEGMFNWSVDGGAGLDDILVFVSHAGDVIPYKGEDPTSESWSSVGTYFIGEIPNTPRFGSEQGGELYLLSTFGVISMGDLLKGVDTNILQSGVEDSSIAVKIGGIIRDHLQRTINLEGWNISMVPSVGGMLISSPTTGSLAPIQYYYNFTTDSWGLWRDVPMNCFTEYNGGVTFGNNNNDVYRMDVPVDDLKITPPAEGLNGDDIEFSILTAFSSLGSQALYKRAKLIRPDFTANLEPVHASICRYDFDITEGVNNQLTEPPLFAVEVWDIALWDAAIWGSNVAQTFPTIGGSWGHGRYVAIATKGTCRTVTRLIGWDLVFDVGGPLV